MVAAKLANLNHGQWAYPDAQICASVKQDTAAEMLNVSRRTVQNAKRVAEDATPELEVWRKVGDGVRKAA
jgi:DNA-binding XRE family transcriptional regulator